MVRAIIGALIALSALGQTNSVTLVPSRSGGAGVEKPCYLEFREWGSNGRDYFRLTCPTVMAAPLNYRIPIVAGQEHDSIAIQAPPSGSPLNGNLVFKPMVTAYDDAPRVQLIEGLKQFGKKVDFQDYIALWDDTDFSGAGPRSVLGAGYLSLRDDPTATVPAVFVDTTGVEISDEASGLIKTRLKEGLLLMTTTGGSVQYKIENSIETLPQISTPSTPPAAGFVLRYAKDGTNCTLDSGGTETCMGSSGSATVNPISYIYSTSGQLRLEQQGDGLGNSSLYLRHRVGESGVTVECATYDLCEFNAKGSVSQMSLRMEGRSGSKYLPLGGSFPEWQFGQSTNYPNDYTLAVHQDAAGVLAGKPFLFTASDGTYSGWRAATSSNNVTWAMPTDAPLANQCLKVLSQTLFTTHWDTCYTPASPSFELPVNFTSSSTTKVAFAVDAFSNARMALYNSSGIVGFGATLGNSASSVVLTDLSGDGAVQLSAGSSATGGSIYLSQADTGRAGVGIEAGAFTLETGRVYVNDYTNNTRARMSNKFETYAAGAFPTAATELGPNAGGHGELILRDGTFGSVRVRINNLGASWAGATPISRTFAMTTSTGTCNLTFDGSFLTSFSGACP